MNYSIVADSSCDTFNLEKKSNTINFQTIPFLISIANNDFIDDKSLDLSEFMESMRNTKLPVRTACASTEAWYDCFKRSGNVIAFTISHNLSGSYNSACSAKNMLLEEEPNKKIAVIDTLSCGPEILLIMDYAVKLIEKDFDFDLIIIKIKQYMKQTHLLFAVSSFDNLVKNGRMSKFKGATAGTLGLIGIGMASPNGKIQIKSVTRGKKKIINSMIQDIQEIGFNGSKIIISHCNNFTFANMLKDGIVKAFADVNVVIKSARGLCSTYAGQNGLLVAF